ncbi:MAG TPA: FtsX-like permease family protein [Trebonia sp.]|nr:FtsX-like permease family protein [Trebonia sp.]
MSVALREPPDLDGGAGGIVARRAVLRWGWRLFRREWRQQLLVLGLLTVAVAATVWGASAVTNAQLADPNYPTFGTAAVSVTLPGADPRLAADIAAIQGRLGPADVIENQNIVTGTTQSVQLRAESPRGRYTAPLLGLVSGAYPAGPGQVALTSQVASLYNVQLGGTWQAAGATWRVTGIVQDPSNLTDEFALVAPGRVTRPGKVTMLLGSAAAQQALNSGDATVPGIPAATLAGPNIQAAGPPQATVILVVEVLGLVFIGLVSVASFAMLAQRRLRALGMLGAIGATGGNLRLVMIVNGLVVGAAGALAGAVLGLAAWFAYAPTLQQGAGHVIDAANLPWWAIAIGVVLAIATSVLASRRPAKTIAAVPVVAALSGRPALPRAAHRSAVPGAIVFAAGLACLAVSGGLAAVNAGSGPGGGSGARPGHSLLLLAGLVASIVGIILLAPLAISVLTAGAGPRLPVAIRIALRDLVRYRARSGAALAATTFAVFLAMGICLVASIRFDNPLNWTGPNLSSSQLIFPKGATPAPGQSTPLSGAQITRLNGQLNTLAASLHAHAVPLETAAVLYQAATQAHSPQNFTGNVYVATPRLLATYGIKPSQIAPGTDILTMRPGLGGVPRLEMIWTPPHSCNDDDPACGNEPQPGAQGGPPCTHGNDCQASPAIQMSTSLPGGTSAPNTLVTEYAVRKYHMQAQLQGWLIQAPAPLTAPQLNAARQLALAYKVVVETGAYKPGLRDFADGATALGILIALGVLAMSVGLIRSETARDLRTLTAAGASSATRRTISAATAAALALLGAIVGIAGAVAAVLAWGHSSLSDILNNVLVTDVLILLIGLPLIAAAAGWLLAGREPTVISRQPLE